MVSSNSRSTAARTARCGAGNRRHDADGSAMTAPATIPGGRQWRRWPHPRRRRRGRWRQRPQFRDDGPRRPSSPIGFHDVASNSLRRMGRRLPDGDAPMRRKTPPGSPAPRRYPRKRRTVSSRAPSEKSRPRTTNCGLYRHRPLRVLGCGIGAHCRPRDRRRAPSSAEPSASCRRLPCAAAKRCAPRWIAGVGRDHRRHVGRFGCSAGGLGPSLCSKYKR